MSLELIRALDDAQHYEHAAQGLTESLHKLQAAVLKIGQEFHVLSVVYKFDREGELGPVRKRAWDHVDAAIKEAEQC